ncbi:MAG: ABC transporter ATP-binding protein [Lachnospiraceae bacterium]|jgi:ABC-type multidrug transport system fused ATPase/permease subunit|nr:ABC transporter ATP-binding protein [Lachnospiraceae bacterium]
MDGKEIKTIQKLFPVIRTLFSTAGRQYPWFFVMEALKTLIQIFQPFLGLFLTPLLVDELCGGRNVRTLATYAAVLVIGECVLSILLARVNTTLQKYQERLDNYFAMEISRHSMGLDFQLTEDKKALDQLEKAVTGMSWYSGGAYGIGEQVFMFIGNVFKIAGFVTVITVHAPALLIVVLIYVVISGWIRSKLNEIELISYGNLSKSNRLFGYFGWEVVDFRFGKDIRLYDARRMLVEKWKKYTEESIGAWKWRADKGYPYNLALDGAGLVRSLITYFYAGYLVIREAFSIGIFTQMISAAGGLDATLGGLVWNVQELMKRCNYAYEYVLFMEYPEAMPKGTAHVKPGEHRIEFRNVTFAYPGTDKKVLDGVNITVEPGEHLSIVGLNGAGKTTFIKLLCRLYDPTEGEILVDGRNIMEYDYKEYVGQFAPVFQDFKIFGFSIGENIVFDNMDQVRLKEILKLTGLDGMTQKLPKGVDTPVFKMFEEDGIEPSGGEQQKMAIARALYKNASVIILDEPTAALDPMAEYEIYKQFHSLVGDKTAFYISHRLSSCRFCDKIAVFSEGGIAEYGSHEELVNISGGIYAKMFEAQAQYYK